VIKRKKEKERMRRRRFLRGENEEHLI